MAQRRMFSPKIVSSDAFLDMPTSSRELYFQLGMYADDDGFVNPRFVMRMTGASQDDLKVIISKRFVLPFENGVIIIKHWLINNTIRQDRYTPTVYTEQKKLLKVKENGAYTELATGWQPNGNQMAPEVKLSQVKLSQVNLERETPAHKAKEFFENPEPSIQELIAKGIPEEPIRAEIIKFISYWTEPNKSGTKQRWETEKTFEVGRRLNTWFGRVREFNQFNKSKILNLDKI